LNNKLEEIKDKNFKNTVFLKLRKAYKFDNKSLRTGIHCKNSRLLIIRKG
jgi:hypothetical protein